MDFSKILIIFRSTGNLSQQEVADRLGISRNYLSQIERGKAKNISFDLGLRILNLNSQHGEVEVTLPRKVLVDGYIATEIMWLNQQDVYTEGCCQGPPPTALIRPSSIEKAKKLGYDPQYENGLYRILLKSKRK